MKKSEIFATIKLANAIVDEMASYAIDSPDYIKANEELGWLLDTLIESKGFSLNLSKKTGHYWVKFF